jgi:hypothetical protein
VCVCVWGLGCGVWGVGLFVYVCVHLNYSQVHNYVCAHLNYSHLVYVCVSFGVCVRTPELQSFGVCVCH